MRPLTAWRRPLVGRCACATLVAATVAIAAAQQASQPPASGQNPPSRPTFRTGTDAVVVDLRVLDRDGKFVGDLTKDDFRIFEDDEEQAIATFSLVNMPLASTATVSATPRVAPDVVSNARADEGRLYVIVLDDLEEEKDDSGTYQGLRSVTVRAIARDFVEHHFADTDRAALITTSGRRNMTVQFTNDRRRLLEAIDRFQGGFGQINYLCVAPPGIGPCVMVRDNLHSVMVSLRSVAEWLAAIDGRRKAIVLVSDRLGRTMKDMNIDLATQEAADVAHFLEAAARANVTLYAIDPVGLPTGKPGNIKTLPLDDHAWLDLDRTKSLEVVAEATGGFAAVHTNDYAAEFDRVVEANSSYYLLGYTPSNTQQDGKFRKIRVEVRRPAGATSLGRFADLQVQARSGYASEKPSASRTTAADALPPDLADLMKSPVPVAGLSLSVAAVPFRGSGTTASVAVIVEARVSDLQLSNQDGRFNGAMNIAIVAADLNGRTQGGERGSLTMRLSQGRRDVVAAQGVRMLSTIDLKPGEYSVNVAAADATGELARGSVRYDLTVPDFSKPLTMSGIALASAATTVIQTNGSDARWKPSLGMTPTTVRSFGTDDELRVFAEIYDNDRKAHSTMVTTTVAAASGRTVFTSKQALSRATDQTTYPVVTSIPLIDMPPGEYVLSIEAQSSATRDRPISRQIPFSVRPKSI